MAIQWHLPKWGDKCIVFPTLNKKYIGGRGENASKCKVTLVGSTQQHGSRTGRGHKKLFWQSRKEGGGGGFWRVQLSHREVEVEGGGGDLLHRAPNLPQKVPILKKWDQRDGNLGSFLFSFFLDSPHLLIFAALPKNTLKPPPPSSSLFLLPTFLSRRRRVRRNWRLGLNIFFLLPSPGHCSVLLFSAELALLLQSCWTSLSFYEKKTCNNSGSNSSSSFFFAE